MGFGSASRPQDQTVILELGRGESIRPFGHGTATDHLRNDLTGKGTLLSDVDDRLMIRLQGGDERAFAELVARHQSPLLGFFTRNLGDRQLAEDLTQDTLLKVYERNWDYLPSGRFGGWMYRIARNLLIDLVRKRTNDALVHSVSRMPGEDGTDILACLPGGWLSAEQMANHSELSELVDQALLDLPEEQRQTFLMHHYAGLALPEVADAMEVSHATAKSRLRLAREKLQASLKPHGVVASGGMESVDR